MIRISIIFKLSGNLEGNRLLGRPRHRWKRNIKVDVEGTVCECVEWSNLAHDRIQ
jgi:hypothetical protein